MLSKSNKKLLENVWMSIIKTEMEILVYMTAKINQTNIFMSKIKEKYWDMVE